MRMRMPLPYAGRMSSLHIDMMKIAQSVGVSQSTVSRALADKPGVSARTRSRVLTAARELGYSRSAAASRLATGTTDTVALVVNHPERWYQSAVIAHAASLLQGAGLDVLVYNISNPRQRDAVLGGQHLGGRADGILIVSASLTVVEEEALATSRLPTVGIGTVLDRFAFVTVDNESEIAAGVQYLLGLNHQRIGLIQGTTEGSRPDYVTQERGHGFRRAMGDRFDDDLVVRVLGDDAEAGGSGLAALLSRRQPPTAVVAETDTLAAGVLQAARRSGIRIPSNLSVLGFDDNPIADLLDLTTLRQYPQAQAERATQMLLDDLHAGAITKDFILLPTTLIVRGTTQHLTQAR